MLSGSAGRYKNVWKPTGLVIAEVLVVGGGTVKGCGSFLKRYTILGVYFYRKLQPKLTTRKR
jgi:hypothetical protein